jgi:hypothetical protein
MHGRHLYGVSAMTTGKLGREISALSNLPISELRERWRKLFSRTAPSAFGPDLLRRSIAFKVQENVYGGLSGESQRMLALLIRRLRENPQKALELPRRIKTGSELVRTWNGNPHRVVVGEEGFIYADEVYKTLSEIARKITGTRWNGPRFFGLRNGKAEDTPKQKTRTNR